MTPSMKKLVAKAIEEHENTPADDVQVLRNMQTIKNLFARVWAEGFANGFVAGRRSRTTRRQHGS